LQESRNERFEILPLGSSEQLRQRRVFPQQDTTCTDPVQATTSILVMRVTTGGFDAAFHFEVCELERILTYLCGSHDVLEVVALAGIAAQEIPLDDLALNLTHFIKNNASAVPLTHTLLVNGSLILCNLPGRWESAVD
jgi:hypothetical protein